MNTNQQLKEELLVSSEERAEALRAYLSEEEARRKGEELLEQRLQGKIERKHDFSI